jgi:hypothetical protein
MLAARTAASDRRVVRLIGQEPAENGEIANAAAQAGSISIAEAVHGQSFECCVRNREPADKFPAAMSRINPILSDADALEVLSLRSMKS